MAVPQKPGNKETVPAQVPHTGQKPLIPATPSRPERPEAPSSSVIPPRSFRGASMDAMEEAEEQANLEKLRKLSSLQPAKKRSEDFRVHSELTANDLLINPWARYAHLEQKVVEIKAWLVGVLNEQKRSEDIGKARTERGAKYAEMYTLMETLMTRYFLKERVVSPADSKIVMAMVANEIIGFGPLEPLWHDDRITEIMVNGPYRIRVQMGGKNYPVPGARFRDSDHLLELCQNILAANNRTVDVAHPMQNGSTSDGSRINVVHTDIAEQGPYLTIRRFPDTAFTLKDLVEHGSMNEEMALLIGNYVNAALSIVVVGGTGSGKTSMLNALSGCINNEERVIVVEDTRELRLNAAKDVLYITSRPSLQDGKGGVTIREIVMNTLRMTPNRIVVGEVRDFTVYDMLQAMNTGHNGSITTTHANDAYGGLERLINLLSESKDEAVDSSRALSLISSAVDLFVVIEKYEDGSRRVAGLYEIPNRVTVEDGNVTLDPIPLWEFEQTGLDENDRIVGDWVKKNELSESMVRKHRLAHRKNRSLEELYELGRVEKPEAE